MTQTIHKGYRRPRWWIFRLWPWIARDKKSISRIINFGMNCSYDLTGDDDDLDVNKIFGIGYLWNKDDSARFGWNYNNETKRVNVFAYYHVDGTRDFTKIGEVLIGVDYLMILNINPGSYSFSVVKADSGEALGYQVINKNHKKRWSYNQGMYFGGTQKAPHDITIEIRNL